MGTSQTIPKSTRVHPFWHTSTSKSHPMASLTGPVHGTSRLRRHHSPKPSSRCSTSERPQANPLKYVDSMGHWLIPLKANQKELLSSLNLPSPDGVHGYLMFLYNQCVVVLDSLFPWETGNFLKKKKKKKKTDQTSVSLGGLLASQKQLSRASEAWTMYKGPASANKMAKCTNYTCSLSVIDTGCPFPIPSPAFRAMSRR